MKKYLRIIGVAVLIIGLLIEIYVPFEAYVGWYQRTAYLTVIGIFLILIGLLFIVFSGGGFKFVRSKNDFRLSDKDNFIN